MSRGASYYNGYYPGYIRVPSNAAFRVVLDHEDVMLHIVRSVRPVVVTDFSNSFRRRTEDGRVFTELDHPIPQVPEDSIVVDFRLHSGENDSAIYTREHDFTFYRRQQFTEITVGAEAANLEDRPSRAAVFSAAIRRFIELYRVATRDVVIRADAQPHVVRERVVPYREPVGDGVFERLVAHIPRSYAPIVFALRDEPHGSPVVTRSAGEIAGVLEYHLASNTRVSEAQRALIDAFDRLVIGRDARFSLVEVLSIAEVVTMDFVNTLRRDRTEVDDWLTRKEAERGRATVREVVQSLLPQLLSEVSCDPPSLLRGLNLALDRRDATLHRREPVSKEEAQQALETTQGLLFAIDDFWNRHGGEPRSGLTV